MAMASSVFAERAEWPVLFESDMNGAMPAGLVFSDSRAWRLAPAEKGKALELFRASNYRPKYRSPFNYALFPPVVDSFLLDVDVRSTGRDYGHRDLCFFFGFRDADHYYYAHLGKAADAHAHSIFAVDGAPRVSIAKERTSGTPWADAWHHVRIQRDTESGDIAVFFDDMTKPVMQAKDRRFLSGKVGVGSFDDTGAFDNVVLRGVATK